MTWRFGFEFNSMTLYNGSRSIWLALHLGRRRYWLSRLATAHAPLNRFRSGPMGWTWGAR